MRLGIFGGTFNPVHMGHLLLAETAREQLRLDRVLFIPTAQPPHKRVPDLLPGHVRATLLRVAVRGHPAFHVSMIELKRHGVSYSVDTVQALRRQFPSATLFLLMGQELLQVPWKQWNMLTRLCTVVVARRSTGQQSASRAAHHARSHQASRVQWLQMPEIGICSSEIRQRIRHGRSIRYWVPLAVERYIHRHRIYSVKEGL